MAKKVITNVSRVCTWGAPPPIYFSIFTWKSSMSADEGPDHDEFHSQQADVDIEMVFGISKYCTNEIF